MKRLKAWVQKILPEDYDKYDVVAKYDSTLTYSENKAEIRDDLKNLITNLKEQAEYAMAQQERFETEKIKEAEAEALEYNNRTYNDNKDISETYEQINRGVKKICQGFSNLLFIRGRGGTGKSYQIRKALIENKVEFVEVCGEVTEAYLYRLIFESNGKILWFKDVVKLLQNQGSMNLLKGATETEDKRLLTKSNYSKAQDDLPDKFICKCKFVFDYNNIYGSQLKDDFEALSTRGDVVEMSFSNEDIKGVMKLICKEDWQKEVTEFLVKEFESNGMVRLNLRTQWKGFKTYTYAQKNGLDWKKELKAELKNISRTRSMLYSLIGTRAVKTSELKKLLLKQEMVSSLRTADRKINEWLYIEELFKWSETDKNFYVCINAKDENQKINN